MGHQDQSFDLSDDDLESAMYGANDYVTRETSGGKVAGLGNMQTQRSDGIQYHHTHGTGDDEHGVRCAGDRSPVPKLCGDQRMSHQEGKGGLGQHVAGPNATLASDILQFLAQETRLFHEHLQAATREYEMTGKVPASLFGVKKVRALQKRSGKKATAGVGRKPTIFNMYIKKRISEIKAEEPEKDHKYTEVFRRVVDEWNAMTPEEKKQYDTLLPK